MAGEAAATGSGPAAQTPAQTAADHVTQNKFGQPAAPAPAGDDKGSPSKEAAAEAMRKFKVKVDNQEVEVDEAELIKGYTHSRAAAKRFQEGHKAKAQAEQFLQMMKDKGQLFDAIKKLGHDPRTLAEEYLAAQIQDDLMDPKEKEIKTYKQKVEEYERAEAKRKEDAQKAEHDRLKAKYAKEFEAQFIDALKQSGLPQTKPMVAEMAKYIRRAANIGYKLAPTDAAKLVKEDKEAELHGVLGDSEAEILVKMLGDKNLEKIRAYEAQRLRNPDANRTTPEDQITESQREKKKSQRMTPAEWRMHKLGKA